MDSNAQFFLVAAAKCLASPDGAFWAFLPGMENNVAFCETLGFWVVGCGNNSPSDFNNNQRAIFLCFCAAMTETGDL